MVGKVRNKNEKKTLKQSKLLATNTGDVKKKHKTNQQTTTTMAAIKWLATTDTGAQAQCEYQKHKLSQQPNDKRQTKTTNSVTCNRQTCTQTHTHTTTRTNVHSRNMELSIMHFFYAIIQKVHNVAEKRRRKQQWTWK